MLKTPEAYYQQAVEEGSVTDDPEQRRVCAIFTKLFYSYQQQEHWRSRYLRTFNRMLGVEQIPVQGIYLWGRVGRGKTYLMDLFYHSLPGPHKTRLHFHRFMEWVHNQLIMRAGEPDPLKKIAHAFAKDCRILCFDEFFVSDIADAMLLSGLFQALFSQGVTLVATSNLPPDNLYENGLQRQKFLPAIEAIKAHTQTVSLDGPEDYRFAHLSDMRLYLTPLNDETEAQMHNDFDALAGEHTSKEAITIAQRSLPTRRCAEGVVWFDFETLCKGPRSANDYIELARYFHTIFMSNLTPMSTGDRDTARRFISLVDELYERHVKLILSASVPMTELYTGTTHAFAFERTVSRLHEMQAPSYLAKPHLP